MLEACLKHFSASGDQVRDEAAGDAEGQ
jgi:hypothetical protein